MHTEAEPPAAGTELSPSVETKPLSPVEKLRKHPASKLFRRYKKQIPQEQIDEVMRGLRNDPLGNGLFLEAWVDPERNVRSPKGTYCTLLGYQIGPGYPPLRVSLLSGGYFAGWGKKDPKTGKRVREQPFGSIIDVARILFDKREPYHFPSLWKEIVWPVWERIRSGELQYKPLTDAELILLVQEAQPIVLPFYRRSGLVTTVARKAPTALALWKSLPLPEREIFGSYTTHREFLRNAERYESAMTLFRVREKTYGKSARFLLTEI